MTILTPVWSAKSPSTLEKGTGVPVAPWEGKYDPVHDRGYRDLVPSGREIQIGADCYFHSSSGKWYRTQRCWQFTDEPETANLGASANPADLLAQLTSAGQVSYTGRTGAGRHAVDTYRFTYSAPVDQWTGTKTGTVDIDVTSKRIIRVRYTLQFPGGLPRPAGVRTDLRLDDFGTPVDVSAPANPIPLPAQTTQR